MPGNGVTAPASMGGWLPIGSQRHLGHLDFSDFADAIEKLADEGKTPVFAAIDDKLAAAIVVADTIKPTSTGRHRGPARHGPEDGDDLGRQPPHRRGHRPPAGHRRGARRGAARRQGGGHQGAAASGRHASPMSATASTMPRPWPKPMSALPSAPARMRPSKAPMSCCSAATSRACSTRSTVSRATMQQHLGEPVLGLWLQRAADPGRGGRALSGLRHPALAR